MNLTKKEKDSLLKLLNVSHALSGLSSTYAECDEIGFKSDYGFTRKYANNIMDKLILELKK